MSQQISALREMVMVTQNFHGIYMHRHVAEIHKQG